MKPGTTRSFCVAAVVTCGAMYSGAAHAADFSYCKFNGAHYCDGIRVTLDATHLTMVGEQTGCESGGAAGPIVIVLDFEDSGVGVTYGYDPAAGFAGIVAATTVNFTKRRWRHIDFNGVEINRGYLCLGPPPPPDQTLGFSSAD